MNHAGKIQVYWCLLATRLGSCSAIIDSSLWTKVAQNWPQNPMEVAKKIKSAYCAMR